MLKAFRILEKVVWVLAMAAIVIVCILMGIGVISSTGPIWETITSLMPYFYVIAAVIVLFKMFILGVQIYMDFQIEERTRDLNIIIQEQRKQLDAHDTKVNLKLDKIISGISAIPNTDTQAIVDFLKLNLPDVVSNLVEQQVEQRIALEKQKMTLEYEKKEAELKSRSLSVNGIIERQERLDKLSEAIRLRAEEERKVRLQNTEEYTSLFFSLAKSSVEDVEKVLEVTKLFIESGHVLADKGFQIALNKNIRNAELKYWADNITKYNRKENLDKDYFLMTVFGEWFTGKKENLSKNYSVLPKDSLISKDGVEADLERLRMKVQSAATQAEE